ncbi:MAG: ribbon-helix-helix protein, CopG family [Promethearchaeota archaeon]
MSNTKLNPQDKRNKLIHLAFSQNEITEIDKHVKQANTSRTEFIRQAIQDKIMKIENPELFNPASNVNTSDFSEFLKEIKTSNKQQKIILEKLSIVKQIQDNFTLLKTIAKEPEIMENEKIIIDILKEHGPLKPLKIMDLADLRSHKVYDVISNENVFSININGKVILKNGE